jgi:hypothetical protein
MRVLVIVVSICLATSTVLAQEGREVFGNFMDMMGKVIDDQMRREAYRNSPEFKNSEIQPGGLTRGQVIIVQQLLLQRGYDVGDPDGIIGPRTMAVTGQLQKKAGVAVTGLPDQQLLDALLQGQ